VCVCVCVCVRARVCVYAAGCGLCAAGCGQCTEVMQPLCQCRTAHPNAHTQARAHRLEGVVALAVLAHVDEHRLDACV